jgi:hypothetical protein
MNGEEKTSGESKAKLWLKRVGVVGFLFFLIKGLIWVGIAVVAYYHAKK